MTAIYSKNPGDQILAQDIDQYKQWLVDGSSSVTSPMNVNNTATFLTTTANQWTVGYNSSNKLVVNVSSAGAVTYTASGASAGHSFANAFTVTGGTISLNASSNFNVNIGTGNSTGVVTIGNSLSGGTIIAGPAGTSFATQLTDGTNILYALDTHVNTSTRTHQFAYPNTTFAAIASPYFTNLYVNNGNTLTLTGTTTVTALDGIGIDVTQPTITDASSVTVTTASTVAIEGAPIAAGSVTITNAYALNVKAGSSHFGGSVVVGGATVNSLSNGGTQTTLEVNRAGGTGYVSLTSDATADTSLLGVLNFGTSGASSGKGAASIQVELDGSGATNASGKIRIYVRNGATFGEVGTIFKSGGWYIGGAGGTDPGTNAVATAGTLKIGSRGSFAAGDKYLICDSSGNVHVSATGPAS